MHIRWRGLELPSRIHCDDTVSDVKYGLFTIEPFEQGFGTTIGNSLRRVLLSSLEGAAVVTLKIEGVSHEFASIDGVLEDVTDIILNIKGIVLQYDGEEPKTITISRETSGEVLAGDIVCDPSIEVVNPEHLVATLTADVPFKCEMLVRRGRGYAAAVENRSPEQELGVIPIDSVFSPILRVRFRTEDMRVGQRTNYDRLFLEIWTDGTIWPEDALVEAGMILRKHLNPFVMYHDMGEYQAALVEPPADGAANPQGAMSEFLDKPVSVLNLSVRAANCLEAARVSSLRELVGMSEPDLLRVRSFGKTSLHEVQRKLADVGLSLGVDVEGMVATDATPPDPAVTDVSVEEDTGSSGSPDDSGGSGPLEVFTMGE